MAASIILFILPYFGGWFASRCGPDRARWINKGHHSRTRGAFWRSARLINMAILMGASAALPSYTPAPATEQQVANCCVTPSLVIVVSEVFHRPRISHDEWSNGASKCVYSHSWWIDGSKLRGVGYKVFHQLVNINFHIRAEVLYFLWPRKTWIGANFLSIL